MVVMAVVLTSCREETEYSFETDSGTWVLFTQPGELADQRAALVNGFVEMDETTGCIYLRQPEFGISFPSVWPVGTVVAADGLVLDDGRTVPEGEWVAGGGGYSSDISGVLDRCPGVNNQHGEVATFDTSSSEIEIGE